jgi:predicted permease
VAYLCTAVEALDVCRAALWQRLEQRPTRISLLDLKLAFRMLVRYPGLTLVAGVSMAFAIWAGASVFEFFQQVVRPTLPLDDGDRIVEVRAWDPVANRVEPRMGREYLAWRDGLRTIEDLGAFRTADRNLILWDAAYPITVADVSPSTFRLARVAPLHGRFFIENDERPEAPPVVVLGFGVWRNRFGEDPTVIGRVVRLGGEETTVVGVMPEGFAFPVNHEAWTPLRLEIPPGDTRAGPGINLFGRLAPGAEAPEASVELAGLAARTSATAPGSDELLRIDVRRYGSAASGFDPTAPESLVAIAWFNLLPVLLLLLISATVALLMFARAAARESELMVRTALGASRRRIVGQLFLEALVLGTVAAIVGLGATGVGIRWLMGMFEAEVMDGEPLPFWVDGSLSTSTVVYAGLLTLLGAFVAGAVPALKLTRGLGARLRQATAGGGGIRMGGVWTAVIVVQVAFTVVFPSVAVAVFREGMALRSYPIAIAGEEFLGVQVQMDRQPPPGLVADTSLSAFLARYRASFQELEERLALDQAVLGVTHARNLPRTYHGWHQIEVDMGAVEAEDPRGHRVARAPVDVDYFGVLGAPLLEGRGFTLADLEPGVRSVMVDQPFIDRVLGGANPIGRRIRYIAGESIPPQPAEGGPWYEIVGVAPDLGVRCGWGYGGIYHPTRPGDSYPLQLILHVRGDPEAFTARVRAVATDVDPTIRLYEPLPLDESTRHSEDAFYDFWITLAFLVSGLAVLISLAAIYSVMSFTVTRRTREIGIRVALGGPAPRVIAAVLRRPLAQVGGGLVLGLVLTSALRGLAFEDTLQTLLIVAGYGILMTAVCATACLVPTRRALAVEPAEALGVDG